MHHAGLIAFLLASAFTGAALYISIVEQPARLSLDDRAMLAEWRPSDHRAVVMLGLLALFSAIAGLVGYGAEQDVSWLVGAIVIILSWPYMFFFLVPVNNRLLASSDTEGPLARSFLRDWGLLEWGIVLIGAAATALFGSVLW